MGKVFVSAPDSFKGSLSAKEVCQAMEEGILRAMPDAVCISVPMADGGEGTMQALVDAGSGQIYEQEVIGPLGLPVIGEYGIVNDGKTAVMEMASASGIQYITKETTNPLLATTYGTGELIKACLDAGVEKIVLGIGGSATNDGGSGMAEALGAKFLDAQGNILPRGGAALAHLEYIDISGLDKRLEKISLVVACDVTNPLCGENGASAVFGPQKGATPEMVVKLDKALKNYEDKLFQNLGVQVGEISGAGAAGGLGAGLLAFTSAKLMRGVDIMVKETGLLSIVQQADYVFTGEGGMDFQTKFGKTPYGVAQAAKSAKKPVIALAGYIGDRVESLYDIGIDAIFGILTGVVSLEEALDRGAENIARTTENIVRLLGC